MLKLSVFTHEVRSSTLHVVSALNSPWHLRLGIGGGYAKNKRAYLHEADTLVHASLNSHSNRTRRTAGQHTSMRLGGHFAF